MSLKDGDWNWEALRQKGDMLLGAGHRLQVAVLLAQADPEELYAARIADAAGVERTEARREIRRFRRAGLLAPTSSPSGAVTGGRGRPAEYLERRNEATWRVLVELARLLERAA